METGNKNIAPGSLGIMLNGTISTFTPWILDLWFLAGEKQYYILDADSEHAQPCREFCPSLAKCLHLMVLLLHFQKAIPQFCQYNFWMVGNMNKISEFHEHSPLMQFFSCEVCFLVRMMCRIPCWWIRQSVSQWIAVLAEGLYPGKANAYIECLSQ